LADTRANDNDDGADTTQVASPQPKAAPTGSATPGGMGNLRRMLDVPLDMTVELGRTQMPLSDVLRLDVGSVVTIDRLPGEPIDLLINGRVFARGEVVVINETFGFRVTELVDADGVASGQMPGEG